MSNNRIFKLNFEKITLEENKKRLFFVLKVLFFSALIYIVYQYSLLTHSAIISRLVKTFLFFIPTNLIISFSRLTMVYVYLKKNDKPENFKDNFVIGIDKIAAILSFFALIISLFVLFEANLFDFLTSISIVAAAIALLSKDYISNMINGMILMFSDQLSINDDVKIGEQKGKVVNITLINLHLLNENDDLIYIPNNTVFATSVVNYTKHSVNKVSVDFELTKRQGGWFAEMQQYLKTNLHLFIQEAHKESIELRIESINRDAVHLRLQFTLLKHSSELEIETRQYAAEAILKFISDKEKTERAEREHGLELREKNYDE